MSTYMPLSNRTLNLHGDQYASDGFAYPNYVMQNISVAELSERSFWWLSRYAHVSALLMNCNDLNYEAIDELITFSTDFDNLTFYDKVKVCNACLVLMRSRESATRAVISSQLVKWQSAYVRHLTRKNKGRKKFGPELMAMCTHGPESALCVPVEAEVQINKYNTKEATPCESEQQDPLRESEQLDPSHETKHQDQLCESNPEDNKTASWGGYCTVT